MLESYKGAYLGVSRFTFERRQDGRRQHIHSVKDTPKKYRPISLLSNLSNLIEKAMAKRTSRMAISLQALTHTQFGGRPDLSATHCILHLLFEMAFPFSNRSGQPRTESGRCDLRPSMFINDIDGRINNVSPSHLISIMKNAGFPTLISNCTESFLNYCTVYFYFDNTRENPKPYLLGLP